MWLGAPRLNSSHLLLDLRTLVDIDSNEPFFEHWLERSSEAVIGARSRGYTRRQRRRESRQYKCHH